MLWLIVWWLGMWQKIWGNLDKLGLDPLQSGARSLPRIVSRECIIKRLREGWQVWLRYWHRRTWWNGWSGCLANLSLHASWYRRTQYSLGNSLFQPRWLYITTYNLDSTPCQYMGLGWVEIHVQRDMIYMRDNERSYRAPWPISGLSVRGDNRWSPAEIALLPFT